MATRARPGYARGRGEPGCDQQELWQSAARSWGSQPPLSSRKRQLLLPWPFASCLPLHALPRPLEKPSQAASCLSTSITVCSWSPTPICQVGPTGCREGTKRAASLAWDTNGPARSTGWQGSNLPY